MRSWFLLFGCCSSCSSSFGNCSKMFGTSCSNFGGFFNGNGSDKGDHFRSNRANKGRGVEDRGAYREVGGGNTETIDGVGGVVSGLQNAISVDILVAATNNTEGILGLGPGRVDVLVTKTELTKLILGMELTGGSHKGSRDGKRSRDRSSECQRSCWKGTRN